MNILTSRILTASLVLIGNFAVSSLMASPVLADPGFESGSLSPWIYSASGAAYSTTNARTGLGCVAFTGGNSTVLQKVTGLIPNTQYKLVGYGKIGTPTTAWIGVNSYGGAQIYGTITGSTYAPVTVTFTTGGTDTSAYVWIGNGGTGTAFGDDFSVTQTIVPASDPQNTAGWVANATLTDEFSGTSLDSTKWEPQMDPTVWVGRAPSQYDTHNVSVSGGLLHLLMSYQNLLPNGTFETGNLNNWTTVSGNPMITNLYNSGVDAPSDWWYGVKLDPGTSIQQTLTGLAPNKTYNLAGKFKIGTGTPVTMTVSGYGGTAKSVALNITDTDAYDTKGKLQWVLRSIPFTTGTASTSAVINVNNSTSTGTTYCDEITVVPYNLPNGFHLNSGRYLTASAIQSKTRPPFGYYEARMKAAPAASSSAFWFQAPLENGERGVEIDVCELVGTPIHEDPINFPNYGRRMPIDTHYFAAAGNYNNSQRPDVGTNVADAFHTYGIDWEADTMTFYFDGTAVRQITQVQPPLVPTASGSTQVLRSKWLIFDTEIFSYYGIPEGTSDFQVDYIRAWTK